MKKQLFPKEFLAHSVEVHQFKYSKSSRRIYWIILLVIIFVIVALPFTKINVYTTVRGMIKPLQERQSLRITTAGQVMYSKLSNNLNVAKGDTLLFLASPVLDEKKRLLNQKMIEHHDFLHDLAALKQNQIAPQLNTPTYKKQWRAFQTKANELNLIKTKLEKDLKRSESLFEKGIIPSVEWETAQHQYTLALAAKEQFLRESLAQWESETHEFTDEQQRLSSNWEQLKQQQLPQ